MPRQPGKYGRKPPKGDPALRLGRLLTGTVPAHPAAADYLAALGGGWQMLGNDQHGDCVAVTWANVRRLVTGTLTGTEVYPDQDQVYAFYETQNPGFPAEDNGMAIQTALEYLVASGGPDGVKAVAFAKVDATDADEVKAAIAIFGYVWTGVNVLAVNEQEFADSQPWDFSPASPVQGGHSVVTGGYGTEPAGRHHRPPAASGGPLSGDEKFITWAAETSFTDAFWANEVEEAWVAIWPEHLGTKAFEQGIDTAALASDYEAITGSPLQT
jgi:hypothetical protein